MRGKLRGQVRKVRFLFRPHRGRNRPIFPHPAVVLLQYISGLQQPSKSLLVDNWLFLLVGHDVSCPSLRPACGRRRLAHPETCPILVQFLPTPRAFRKKLASRDQTRIRDCVPCERNTQRKICFSSGVSSQKQLPHRSLGERTPSEFACPIALNGDLTTSQTAGNSP